MAQAEATCDADTPNLNWVNVRVYLEARPKNNPSFAATARYNSANNYRAVCYAQYKRFSDGTWTSWTPFSTGWEY